MINNKEVNNVLLLDQNQSKSFDRLALSSSSPPGVNNNMLDTTNTCKNNNDEMITNREEEIHKEDSTNNSLKKTIIVEEKMKIEGGLDIDDPADSPSSSSSSSSDTTNSDVNVIIKNADNIENKNSITTTNKRRMVQFDSIQVREYPFQLGDSVPSCGVPVGLSWVYALVVTAPVNDYEAYKTGTPRKGQQMILPSAQRTEMLLNQGVPMRDITRTVTECEQIRKDRWATASRHEKWDKIDYALEKAKRKIFKKK